MLEEFQDLPVHPLLVHIPLVLIPLLIAVGVGYALVPRVRKLTGWAVVSLAVIAPIVTWLARESGYEFKERLAARDMLTEQLAADIDEHARLSYTLIWLVVGLAVASLALVVAGRVRNSDVVEDEFDADGRPSAAGSGKRIVVIVAAAAVIGLGGASAWYLYETGDLGARMAWEGR